MHIGVVDMVTVKVGSPRRIGGLSQARVVKPLHARSESGASRSLKIVHII